PRWPPRRWPAVLRDRLAWRSRRRSMAARCPAPPDPARCIVSAVDPTVALVANSCRRVVWPELGQAGAPWERESAAPDASGEFANSILEIKAGLSAGSVRAENKGFHRGESAGFWPGGPAHARRAVRPWSRTTTSRRSLFRS